MQKVHDPTYRRFVKDVPHTRTGHSPQSPRIPTSARPPLLPRAETPSYGHGTESAFDKHLLSTARAERALFLLRVNEQDRQQYDTPAPIWNNLAVTHLDNWQWAKAFRSLINAIASDPNIPALHNNLGILYLEIGDLPQASRLLNRAIALQPNRDTTLANRGLARLEATQHQSALEDMSQALVLAPNEPLHHNNLGVLYLQTGDLEQALQMFQQAIGMDDTNDMYFHNRGMTYDQMGAHDDANRDYAHAYQMTEAQLKAELEPSST